MILNLLSTCIETIWRECADLFFFVFVSLKNGHALFHKRRRGLFSRVTKRPLLSQTCPCNFFWFIGPDQKSVAFGKRKADLDRASADVYAPNSNVAQ